MRRLCGKAVHAKIGDEIVVVCRLRKGMTDARLSVWSACPGYDMSPHVQHNALGVLIQGRPHMVQPMYFRLIAPHFKKNTLTFTVDEDLEFCIQQDVDTPAEPLARARIKVYHGSFSKRARWLLQNVIWFLRSRSKIGGRSHA